MSARGRGDGYILVAVLAVVVVLAGLVAAGTLVARSASGTARVADDGVRSAGLLSSGVEVAALQLAVLRIRPELVDGRPVRLTGGTVTPHVVDEGGRIDLNAASPKLLAGALAETGMDGAAAQAVVERIVALRGPANGVIADAAGSPAAAPAGNAAASLLDQATARAAGPASGQSASPGRADPGASAPARTPARRRGLQSVDDLRDIDGIRREDMRLLREVMTVYNPDGRINVMSASPEVLMAMPGMTELKLTQLLAAREGGSEADAQAALGAELSAFVKVVPGPAYTVRVDAAEKGGRRRSAVAVIAASKSPAQPYYILDWQD